jgi:hypothetical protein
LALASKTKNVEGPELSDVKLTVTLLTFAVRYNSYAFVEGLSCESLLKKEQVFDNAALPKDAVANAVRAPSKRLVIGFIPVPDIKTITVPDLRMINSISKFNKAKMQKPSAVN